MSSINGTASPKQPFSMGEAGILLEKDALTASNRRNTFDIPAVLDSDIITRCDLCRMLSGFSRSSNLIFCTISAREHIGRFDVVNKASFCQHRFSLETANVVKWPNRAKFPRLHN